MKRWLLLLLLVPVFAQAENILVLGMSNAALECSDWKNHYNTDPNIQIFCAAKFGMDFYEVFADRYSGGVDQPVPYDYFEFVDRELAKWGVNHDDIDLLLVKNTISLNSDPSTYPNPKTAVPLKKRIEDLTQGFVWMMEELDKRFPNAKAGYLANRSNGDWCGKSPKSIADATPAAIIQALSRHNNPKWHVGPDLSLAAPFTRDDFLNDGCHPKHVARGAGVGSGLGTDRLAPIMNDFFNKLDSDPKP